MRKQNKRLNYQPPIKQGVCGICNTNVTKLSAEAQQQHGAKCLAAGRIISASRNH